MPDGLGAKSERFALVDGCKDRPLEMHRLWSPVTIAELTKCLQSAMASKPKMKAKYPYL